MNTELLKSKLLEAAFNGSLTHADTSKWKKVKLEEVGTIITGSTPSKAHKEYYGNDYPFYKPSDLDAGINVDSAEDNLSRIGYEHARHLPSYSVLVTCIASVGKTGLIRKEGTCNQQINAIVPNDECNCFYLYYLMISPTIQEKIKFMSRSTTVAILNKTRFSTIEIPLPPLPEQERIVSALEEGFAAIDAIAEAKANLSNTAEMLRSKILQAAFDGSLTGADISRWDKFQLGEIFSMKAGKNISASQIHNEKSDKFPYPCYGGNGIRGYVDSYNTEGTFSIIGRQGALCGNVKHVEGKFYATEHAVVVSNIKDVDTQWAYHALTYLDLNQYATSTAQPGLSVKKIEQITIPLPPLAEQERIVAKIESLFTEIDKLSK